MALSENVREKIEDAIWQAVEDGATRDDIEREVGYVLDNAEDEDAL